VAAARVRRGTEAYERKEVLELREVSAAPR
jgi:hypothetical protein